MGSYTERLIDESYNFIQEFQDNGIDNCYDIIEYLKDDNFRAFGERLGDFVRGIANDQNIDCIEFLIDRMKKNNVHISRGKTQIKEWLEADSVIKRKNAFLLVFSMGLNIEQTEDFFRRVCFDRPFDVKNTNEMVYAYCIKNGLGYTKAEELISTISNSDSITAEKATMYTCAIQNKVLGFKDEEAFIEYAKRHLADKEFEQKRAHETFEYLKQTIKNRINCDGEVFEEIDKDGNVILRSKTDFLSDEDDRYMYEEINDDGKKKKTRSRKSDSFLYDYLLQTRSIKLSGSDTNFKKNIKDGFPIELLKNFTEVMTLSKIKTEKKISYDEMRKAIILFLFSNWASQKVLNPYEFEDICNDTLEECGYSTLYYGNPFDWLFLTAANFYEEDTAYDGNVDKSKLDITPIDFIRDFIAYIKDVEEE